MGPKPRYPTVLQLCGRFRMRKVIFVRLMSLLAEPIHALSRDATDPVRFGGVILKFLEEQSALPGMDVGSLTPAQLVRLKPLSDLTEPERRWMSMDRVLNPDLYLDKMVEEDGQPDDDLDTDDEGLTGMEQVGGCNI